MTVPLDTSIEATSGANKSEALTSPVAAPAAPRAAIMTFFSGTRTPTGAGTNGIKSLTSAELQAPTAGTNTGEPPAALAAMPNAPAKEPEPPSAATQSATTTIATSDETMQPGEAQEWQHNDGEALVTEPQKKRTRGHMDS